MKGDCGLLRMVSSFLARAARMAAASNAGFSAGAAVHATDNQPANASVSRCEVRTAVGSFTRVTMARWVRPRKENHGPPHAFSSGETKSVSAIGIQPGGVANIDP